MQFVYFRSPEIKTKPMNSKTIYAFSFSIMLFLFVSCTGRQEKSETPALVRTARATLAETSQRKEFPFISKPLRTSELSFRVSGPIDRFEAYAGNHYKQGSIIAEIDPRDFRLRKEHTEAVYRQAKAEFERIEALYHKDNVSASTYEKARADYIATRTAFDKAAADLEDTRLIAPFSGYVGEVYIEKFQDVRAAQPVVSFVDLSKLRIEIYVTQDIAMQADELRSVSLAFDHRPNQVFSANVVECARSTTPNNLSYLLTAQLPNPDGKLPAGLSGKVFFDLPGTEAQTVSIPQSALCHRPSVGDYVWVVNPSTNKVSQRRVVAGELLPEGRITIKSGLNPDETVAVSGLRFLSEDMAVEISDRPEVQPVNVSGK